MVALIIIGGVGLHNQKSLRGDMEDLMIQSVEGKTNAGDPVFALSLVSVISKILMQNVGIC